MLQQLLEQLGIHDYSALSAEEKKTYEQWAKVLATTDANLDDVRKLVAAEYDRAAQELSKFDTPKDRMIFYQVLAHLTDTLGKFIAAPGAQRDALKTHLREVFHIDV